MCSKNDTVCRGCCEELTVGGMQLCAYREVCAGIEGGVDSSAKIHKANINTNRRGHLTMSLEGLDYVFRLRLMRCL